MGSSKKMVADKVKEKFALSDEEVKENLNLYWKE